MAILKWRHTTLTPSQLPWLLDLVSFSLVVWHHSWMSPARNLKIKKPNLLLRMLQLESEAHLTIITIAPASTASNGPSLIALIHSLLVRSRRQRYHQHGTSTPHPHSQPVEFFCTMFRLLLNCVHIIIYRQSSVKNIL